MVLVDRRRSFIPWIPTHQNSVPLSRGVRLRTHPKHMPPKRLLSQRWFSFCSSYVEHICVSMLKATNSGSLLRIIRTLPDRFTVDNALMHGEIPQKPREIDVRWPWRICYRLGVRAPSEARV